MTTVLQIADAFALPLDMVTEATAIVATRGAGKSSASAVIVEESFPAGVQSVVFDRTGVYWGLRSDKRGNAGGLPIYVLGGPHGDVPLEPHAGAMIADLVVDSGHSFVLDFSDFSKAATIKFAADFLERLYDRKARSRSTTLLILDEAHFYAPQTPRGGFKGDAARLMGAMEDAVGLGRSRGLGIVLTTQRTQSLNKAVLDLIETLIVMRMLSPRARKAVREWIQEKHEEDELGVIASLDSLPDGTAWVWSPLRGILEKVALRRITTFDSYATPKPGEVKVEPRKRRELDLTALGEQMAATKERAEANDPAKLRQEIARLNAELAKAPTDVPGEPEWSTFFLEQGWKHPDDVAEPTVVEVPVLDEALVAQLREALGGGTDALRGIAQDIADDLRLRVESVEEAAARIARALETKPPTEDARPAAPPRDSSTSPRPAPPAPPQTPAPRASGPEAAAESSASGGTGDVSASDRRVLDALAWYEAVGIPTPKRSQVGFVAKYRKGGRFDTLVSSLRTRGLVTYPQDGHLALTPEGRALARSVDLPRTNEAVQAAVLEQLSGSQAKILRVVLAHHPNPIAREQLGELTEYRKGGRFDTLVSSLKTLGLLTYPTKGEVVAAPILFPLAA